MYVCLLVAPAKRCGLFSKLNFANGVCKWYSWPVQLLLNSAKACLLKFYERDILVC